MEWKGSDGRFYCNEFCADAGEDPVGRAETAGDDTRIEENLTRAHCSF